MKIELSPILAGKIPVERILFKLEEAFKSESVQYHLRSMRFDSRFTKPVTISGLDVLAILRNSSGTVGFVPYWQNYAAWKMFPVNAHKKTNVPDLIHFNVRQLNLRTLDQWEETAWHELFHYADSLSIYNFGHGKNSLKGKDETCPVKLARFMANWKI